ncbi:MAG: hypothetical protein HFH85_21125 [Lachnospiraceae bacterium]|nr:hypothetical protein [Lachnospiraceae bacterium]
MQTDERDICARIFTVYADCRRSVLYLALRCVHMPMSMVQKEK